MPDQNNSSAAQIVINGVIDEIRSWAAQSSLSDGKPVSIEELNKDLSELSGGMVKLITNKDILNYAHNPEKMTEDTGITDLSNLSSTVYKKIKTTKEYSSSVNRLERIFSVLLQRAEVSLATGLPLDFSIENPYHDKAGTDLRKGLSSFFEFHSGFFKEISGVERFTRKLVSDTLKTKGTVSDTADMENILSQIKNKIFSSVEGIKEAKGLVGSSPIDLTWYREVSAGAINQAINKLTSGAAVADISGLLKSAAGYIEAYFYLHYVFGEYKRDLPDIREYVASAAEKSVKALLSSSDDKGRLSRLKDVSGREADKASKAVSGPTHTDLAVLDIPEQESEVSGLTQEDLETIRANKEEIISGLKSTNSDAFSAISSAPNFSEFNVQLDNILRQKAIGNLYSDEAAASIYDTLAELFPDQFEEFYEFSANTLPRLV